MDTSTTALGTNTVLSPQIQGAVPDSYSRRVINE